MDDVNKKIKNIIDSNNIVLFMKGTAKKPYCGFSKYALKILKSFKTIYKRKFVVSNHFTQNNNKNCNSKHKQPQ